jgi:hypothetical protein
MNAGARCMVVTVAICSWIAISNHCAFAALATKPASAQNECPFHSKPAKQKEQSSQVQCCKVLRAVVLAKTKSWTRDHANFRRSLFTLRNGRVLRIRELRRRRCFSIPGRPARTHSLS